MKIYTKTGDSGTTSLFGGKRISKDDLRIESYGTIDELNSFIGLLNTSFSDSDQNTLLLNIQNRLFDIGSSLACDPEKPLMTPDIRDEDIAALEYAMDKMDTQLQPLRNFILPGGISSVAYAHVCRTVCRRAERRLVSLSQDSAVDSKIVIYINRLSDYFFILGRYIAHIENIKEVIWKGR